MKSGEKKISKMSRIDGKSKATAAAAKKKPNKYKKAPQAPKRFKSAFIFFSSAKHPEIRKQLGEKGGTEKVSLDFSVLFLLLCTQYLTLVHYLF